MKQVNKSVLLWYSPREMYDLVAGIPDYPRFLPWCSQAEILETHADGVTARLHLHFAGIRQSFTTRNVVVPGESLRMDLVDGPFSVLEGLWRFEPIGQASAGAEAAAPAACKVGFELRYAFASKPLELVVSPVFDRIANTFVDAFVKRAEQVYGAR